MSAFPAPSHRQSSDSRADLVAAAGRRMRGYLFALGVQSGAINVLTLTGSLFMLQIYDRVMTSRSVPTLLALLGIVLFLYVVQATLEAIRTRMVTRLGQRLDEELANPAFDAAISLPALSVPAGERPDPVRDLDHIRNFIASPGPLALFDLPWVPMYLLICFLFHPMLGWLTAIGALVVSSLAIYGEFRSRALSAEVTRLAAERQSIVDGSRRNAEVLSTMNLAARLRQVFNHSNQTYVAAGQNAVDRASGISAAVRAIRMLLQSGMLALGAWLAIRGEISAGAIIATSILSSRALAPIDQAVANWRSFGSARLALSRLRRTLARFATAEPQTMLPAPGKTLRVENGFLGPPGATVPTVSSVNFTVQAGDGLAIIGPSGTGKTTLARALTGIWPLMRGEVTLDGAPLHQYSRAALGAAIGYLPQDVDLFDGTIAENIARFDPQRTDEAVVRAAQLANVHQLILKFPKGYDTRIGDGGLKPSAGQRQRIGLARALYGDPFVIVLDEPYSNLDGAGDDALNKALLGVRMRGGIVVLIAHRRSAIRQMNKLLTIMEGRQTAFGDKEQVLQSLDAASIPQQPDAGAGAAGRPSPLTPGAPATPIAGRIRPGNVQPMRYTQPRRDDDAGQ